MHVLTKIFVVLVSLLTVMLVPLVVSYAYNENSYQAKFQAAEASAAAARAEAQAAQASFGAAETKKNAQLQESTNRAFDLQRRLDDKLQELRKLEARLADAESMDAEIQSQLATLARGLEAGQELNRSLIDELRGLRSDILLAERQKVELDEALRDREAQLEVATAARRSLEEELQRMKDETAGLLRENSLYYARYGGLEATTAATTFGGLPIGVDLDSRILEVRRSGDQVLAEIDAGSLDGIETGWVVPIGRDGFIANLRIINVDINRSTGVVELEQDARGRVQVGDRVIFRKNR